VLLKSAWCTSRLRDVVGAPRGRVGLLRAGDRRGVSHRSVDQGGRRRGPRGDAAWTSGPLNCPAGLWRRPVKRTDEPRRRSLDRRAPAGLDEHHVDPAPGSRPDLLLGAVAEPRRARSPNATADRHPEDRQPVAQRVGHDPPIAIRTSRQSVTAASPRAGAGRVGCACSDDRPARRPPDDPRRARAASRPRRDEHDRGVRGRLALSRVGGKSVRGEGVRVGRASNASPGCRSRSARSSRVGDDRPRETRDALRAGRPTSSDGGGRAASSACRPSFRRRGSCVSLRCARERPRS